MHKITKDVLNEVLKTVKDTKKFVLNQTPAVCQEIITLGRVTNTLMTVGGLLLMIASIVTVVLLGNQAGWIDYSDHSPTGVGIFIAFLGLLPIIFGLLAVMNFLEPMLMAWIAPKTYIVRYINSIIHGN